MDWDSQLYLCDAEMSALKPNLGFRATFYYFYFLHVLDVIISVNGIRTYNGNQGNYCQEALHLPYLCSQPDYGGVFLFEHIHALLLDIISENTMLYK